MTQQMPLEWFTAVGTVAAACAAVVAILVSVALVLRDHRREVLRDRLRGAVELLATFEELQTHHVHEAPFRAERPAERNQLLARFRAQLWASAELVPITRVGALRHSPFGDGDEEEARYYAAAPAIGNPESDQERDMKMRAELIQAVTDLRSKLSGKVDPVRTWKGRQLSG